MKKYFLTLVILLVTIFNAKAQSPFQGTWKWESNNQRFYVYIISQLSSQGDSVVRLDYKMVTFDSNNIETEVYNSKIQGQYFWAGAIISENSQSACGTILDRTFTDTTDGLSGRFGLQLLPLQPGMNQTMHWKITKHSDYLQPASTTNPPNEFNLPTDIILTKI